MIIIACVDDANGMMFNKRRQSQDRVLREYILSNIKKKKTKLWMNAYTRKQFKEEELIQEGCENIQENIAVEEDFLEKAQAGEVCFVENIDITPYLDKIEKVILFKWNRSYPGDFFFPVQLFRDWTMENEEEFVGYSHEKITKEEYKRG